MRRKMNVKMLKHHLNECCKILDASDLTVAAAGNSEEADDGVLNLAGPETPVNSPDDEDQTGAMDSRAARRGNKSISMREAFGLSMNGPLHQHQPKKP